LLNIANKRTADELDGIFFLLLNKANKRTADELDGIIVKYSQLKRTVDELDSKFFYC
jgi:hypothetical protein